MSDERDLVKLAIPFPKRLVKSNPTGYGSYVPHPLYAQRLLLHLGGYDFTVVEIIRGHVDALAPNPKGETAKAKAGSPALTDAIVGVVMRLGVTIDGRPVVIEDVGDCEQPHNWSTDGARLKDAISDALKRCCARIGLGLRLYCKSDEEYMLLDSLRKQDADVDADTHEPRPVEDTADPTLLPDDDPGRPM